MTQHERSGWHHGLEPSSGMFYCYAARRHFLRDGTTTFFGRTARAIRSRRPAYGNAQRHGLSFSNGDTMKNRPTRTTSSRRLRNEKRSAQRISFARAISAAASIRWESWAMKWSIKAFPARLTRRARENASNMRAPLLWKGAIIKHSITARITPPRFKPPD